MESDHQAAKPRTQNSRRRAALSAFAVGLLALAAAGCGGGRIAEDENAGPLDTSPETIEKGAYLAAAGDCVSCHTAHDGGAPFAGGHAFHTPFGVLHSTNITPDPETGLGDWNLAEFNRAMRKGVSADGRHLYPVFPYTAFTKASDEDIAAIYAYLQTLDPVSAPPLKNEMKFPFGMRSLMGVWKAMNFKPARFTPAADQSAQWNRGAYLVEGFAHCGACHTPRNSLGAEREDEAFSGAVYLDDVEDGVIRPWAAVNLTPSPAGLGHWSEEDIAQYLLTGHSARAGSFGPMNEVIANSTTKLEENDARAIASYLKSLPALDRNKPYEVPEDVMRDGERIYTIHCGTCHLPTGAGDPSTGPPLAGSAIVQAPDPASLINVMVYGAQIPQPAPMGAWGSMEAFGEKLDDEEIAALANYMRNSWGNAADEVTVKDVETQR